MGLRHDGGAEGGLRVVRVSAAEVDECKNVVCGGDSKCIDGVDTFTCKCAPGWQVFVFVFVCLFFFFFFIFFFAFWFFVVLLLYCIALYFFFRAVEKTKFAKVTTSFPIALIDSTSSRTGADINECIGVDCGGAGICHNLVNHFSCTCSKGWAGGGLNERCTGSKIEIDSK